VVGQLWAREEGGPGTGAMGHLLVGGWVLVGSRGQFLVGHHCFMGHDSFVGHDGGEVVVGCGIWWVISLLHLWVLGWGQLI